MNESAVPTDPEPDDVAHCHEARPSEIEVKYRPAGWMVECSVDGKTIEISGPHSARELAEASARKWQS